MDKFSSSVVITNEIHASQGLGYNGTFLIPNLSPHIACQQYGHVVALQILPIVLSLQNQFLSKFELECLDYDAQHVGTWQPMVVG